jgi:hypothetical protein
MIETAARIAGSATRRVLIVTSALMQNATGIIGAGLITTGVGLIYRPGAFIVSGAFLLLADWHGNRPAVRE